MTKLLALASTVFILSLSIGPADAQSCASLRQACLMKDSLGEQGQGNCKRFRQRCGGGGGGGDIFGGGGGGINCNQLRNACMFKNEFGQQGQGNCKRFRQFCT